jgi:hypothetical protein
MRKIAVLFVLSALELFIYSPEIFSQGVIPVDIETAKIVARKYCLQTDKKFADTSEKDLVLSLAEAKSSGADLLYYVFNINSKDGFIIISADRNTTPVLCYVPQGNYTKYPELRPPGFNDWLGAYESQIESSLKSVTKSKLSQDSWSGYLAKGSLDVETMVLKLTSKWNQTEYFNGLSPATGTPGHPSYTPSYGGRTPTGCVATAMGQIMYYYQWPPIGVGTHTYNDPANPNPNSSCGSTDDSYGNLSFINHNSTYNYAAMVDVPTSTNAEISKLMYNSAVSVDMDFAYCQSWTNTSNVENALRDFFDYNSSIDYIKKSDYTQEAWENVLIGEIRKERPVQYRGQSSAGTVGHSWVCYGYQTVAGAKEFMFNWGWGGDGDGFFSLTNLNKWPLNDLSTENGAVISIYPSSQPNLTISAATVTPDPVLTLTQFNLSFTVTNSGTRNAIASTAKCYLSTDNILDKNDIYLASINTPSLTINQTTDISKSVVIGDVPTAIYYVLVEADTYHDVHESDESDNIQAVQISVQSSPVSPGDYRSAASGLWSDPNTWQYFNGIDWIAATNFPVSTSGKIYIRSSHTVTVSNSMSVDEVLIMPGGQVSVTPGYVLTIANGPDADDFIVNGTLLNSGTITSIGKLTFNSGSVYEHAQDGGTIPIATWAVDSDCNITGIISTAPTFPLLTQPFGNVTYNCPGQNTDYISLAGGLKNIAGNFTLISTGGGQNDLRLGQSTPGDLTVGGNFIQTGGTFLIIGNPGSAMARKMTIGKDFLLENGSFAMSYLDGAATLDVGGNFTSYGAFYFAYNSTTPDIINITGNCSIAGGTFEMSRTSAIGTLNVGGNFSHITGTINETSTGSGAIVFKGSGIQTYTSGGTLDGTINFTVNNGSTLQMGTGSVPAVISSGSTGTFTLASGATLGITSPLGITADGLSGNIQVAGTRIYNSGASYIYNGSGGQVSGNGLPMTVNSLTVSGLSDLSLSGSSLTVTNDITIGAGAKLNIASSQQVTTSGFINNGTMVLESTAVDNSGSFIATGGLSQIGGSITYNRQLRTKSNFGDYHLFSSPVANQSIAGFKSANIANIMAIKAWDETNATWPNITNAGGNLNSGQGYSIKQTDLSNGKFSFTGSLVNSGSFTATSPYKTGYTDRSSQSAYGLGNEGADIWATPRSWTNYGAGGWNLLGNPFTSAMNAGTFISANSASFDPNYKALYIFDGTVGQYKYAAADVPGYPVNGSLGNKIQAGQGFFVLALYNGINFNFNSSMQVHDVTVPVTKSAIKEIPWPGLQLKAKYDSIESSTIIVYNEMMKTGLDPGYDVGLYSAGADLEIFTSLVSNDNGVNFTRQALPVDDIDKYVVPVGINMGKGGEVTFSALTNPVENIRFFLEDRKMGTFTDLCSDRYTISLPEKTYGTGRFFIYASINAPTPILNPGESIDKNIRIWTIGNILIVEGAVSSKSVAELYNIQGNKIFEKRLVEGAYNSLAVPSVAKGVYIVRLKDGKDVIIRKVVFM